MEGRHIPLVHTYLPRYLLRYLQSVLDSSVPRYIPRYDAAHIITPLLLDPPSHSKREGLRWTYDCDLRWMFLPRTRP